MATRFITLWTLGAFLWGSLGLSVPFSAQAAERITISVGLPYGGLLDSHHNAETYREPVSNTLYILRNTAMEDILNTRKALRVLLGGTERTRQLKRKRDFSFAVPHAVRELYVNGPGRNLGYQDSEITESIQWLDDVNRDPSLDVNQRALLINGLAFMSATITQVDMHLKFLNEDYFNDREVSNQIWEHDIYPTLRTMHMMGAPRVMDTGVTDSANQRIKAFYMRKQIEDLTQLRESLLDRYHLLAIKVSKKPLYQHLYQALVEEGFPSPQMVQVPPNRRVPGIAGNPPVSEIELPQEFRNQLEAAFEKLHGVANIPTLQRIVEKTNDNVDRALLSALDYNTDRLKALCSDIHFSGKRSSPLFELALFPELWESALQKHQYLSGIIDFKAGRQQIDEFLKKIESRRKTIRYVTYTVGIGVGVAAIVFSGGTATPLVMGISAKGLLLGAGLLSSAATTAVAYTDYDYSKRHARMAQGLHEGSTQFSTNQHSTGAQEMLASDHSMLITSLILLGMDFTLLKGTMAGQQLIQKSNQLYVRFAKPEFDRLVEIAKKVIYRGERMAPMGQALANIVRSVLKISPKLEPVALSFDRAITDAAIGLKMSREAVKARVLENPMLRYLVEEYRGKVSFAPDFIKTLVRENSASFALGVLGEALTRKDKFFDEFGTVSQNLLTGMFVTTAYVWVDTPTRIVAAAGREAEAKVISNLFQSGLSMKDRAQYYGKQAAKYGIIGVSSNIASAAVTQTVEHIRNPDDKTIKDRIIESLQYSLYGGSFAASSSLPRTHLRYLIDQRIRATLGRTAGADLMVMGYRYMNNMFGSWQFIKVAKKLGLDNPERKLWNSDKRFLGDISRGTNPDTGFIPAYIRIEPDQADAASHMFDFLRGESSALVPGAGLR